MSHLTRSVLVRSPQRRVAAVLRRIVEDDVAGSAWSFTLRAPVFLTSLAAEIVLSGATIARLGAGGPAATGALVAVAWEPAGGGAFPRFSGNLWSEAETLCASWLRLEGDYESAPDRLRLSERGERAIGHRIALATAKLLLDDVAAAVTRLCAA